MDELERFICEYCNGSGEVPLYTDKEAEKLHDIGIANSQKTCPFCYGAGSLLLRRPC